MGASGHLTETEKLRQVAEQEVIWEQNVPLYYWHLCDNIVM